jgi:hypothetical protein
MGWKSIWPPVAGIKINLFTGSCDVENSGKKNGKNSRKIANGL